MFGAKHPIQKLHVAALAVLIMVLMASGSAMAGGCTPGASQDGAAGTINMANPMVNTPHTPVSADGGEPQNSLQNLNNNFGSDGINAFKPTIQPPTMGSLSSFVGMLMGMFGAGGSQSQDNEGCKVVGSCPGANACVKPKAPPSNNWENDGQTA